MYITPSKWQWIMKLTYYHLIFPCVSYLPCFVYFCRGLISFPLDEGGRSCFPVLLIPFGSLIHQSVQLQPFLAFLCFYSIFLLSLLSHTIFSKLPLFLYLFYFLHVVDSILSPDIEFRNPYPGSLIDILSTTIMKNKLPTWGELVGSIISLENTQ